MRWGRAFLVVVVALVGAQLVGVGWLPAARATGPTATDLAPKKYQFGGGSSSLADGGNPYPMVIGSARAAELAVGDVAGDGNADDDVLGGNDGKVYVMASTTGHITSFTPFSGYTGPLFVAAGNLDADPAAEIVVATGTGAPGRYRIFNGDGTPVASEVVPYDSAFAGGVRVAVGNVTGDAANEVLTAAGPGGASQISEFTLAGSRLGSFIAFDPSFSGGAFVAAGNLDGDAADEILVGPGRADQAHEQATRGFNADGSSVTLNAPLPLMAAQGDTRVAAGKVAGVPVIVQATRSNGVAEITVTDVNDSAHSTAEVHEADGNLAPAIENGTVIASDTGPRLIALSTPTVAMHTRVHETLYGAGLQAAMDDGNVYLDDANHENVTAIGADALNGDDLAFDVAMPAFLNAGTMNVRVGSNNDDRSVYRSMLTLPPSQLNEFITTGVGAGGGPHVRTFNSDGPVGGGFMAGPTDVASGVRVARGDLENNGIDEIITGAGRGSAPYVRVFGRDGDVVREFLAYDASFLGGIFVAVGDVDGDGQNDIVTAADAGGGPHVRVFSATGVLEQQFMAYDPSFTGGVRVATADIDGDGVAEIITAPGRGGGPHVKAVTDMGDTVGQFMAYDPKFTGGVFVAGADVDGDGIDEIITGPGAGGGPHVRVFAPDGTELSGFMAYDPSFTGGVSVGRVGDEMLGPDLIVVGAGPGGGPHVKLLDGDGNEVDSFYAYDPNVHGGVFVAGGIA